MSATDVAPAPAQGSDPAPAQGSNSAGGADPSVATPAGSTSLSSAALVLAGLRAELVDGSLTAGAVLYETAVGERFGVSRTPAREALTVLASEGLLERRPRGYAVIDRSPEQVIEIFDARIALEGEIAAFAAERRSAFDLETLHRIDARTQTLVDELDTAPDRDAVVDRVLALNSQWHTVLRDSAHHGLLHRLLGQVLDLQRLHNDRMRVYDTATLQEGIDEHVAIVDALRARDAERAARLVRDHLAVVRQTRLEQLVARTEEPA